MNEEMHALIREIKQKVLELEYLVYMDEGELKMFDEVKNEREMHKTVLCKPGK